MKHSVPSARIGWGLLPGTPALEAPREAHMAVTLGEKGVAWPGPPASLFRTGGSTVVSLQGVPGLLSQLIPHHPPAASWLSALVGIWPGAGQEGAQGTRKEKIWNPGKGWPSSLMDCIAGLLCLLSAPLPGQLVSPAPPLQVPLGSTLPGIGPGHHRPSTYVS